MKMRSIVPMRIAKLGYIAVSIAFMVFGLAMVFYPDIVLDLAGLIFVIFALTFGVVKLIGYFSKDLYRLAFEFDLQFGILLLVLGLITLFRPANALNFICIASGICFMIDGLFRCRIAFEARSFGIKSWWMAFAAALFTAAMGVVMICNSYEAACIVITLLGISLFAEGLLSLCVTISMVKIVKNQIPDVIDADYTE